MIMLHGLHTARQQGKKISRRKKTTRGDKAKVKAKMAARAQMVATDARRPKQCVPLCAELPFAGQLWKGAYAVHACAE